MAFTARLSQRFYQQFGDEITNELVDLMNGVDASYRSEVRETIDANFVRFDAKLEQRFAEYDAKMEQRFAAVDVRFASLEATFDKRLADLRVELVRWMFLLILGSTLTNHLLK